MTNTSSRFAPQATTGPDVRGVMAADARTAASALRKVPTGLVASVTTGPPVVLQDGADLGVRERGVHRQHQRRRCRRLSVWHPEVPPKPLR